MALAKRKRTPVEAIARRQAFLDRMTGEMARLQKRWQVLLNRKARIQKWAAR